MKVAALALALACSAAFAQSAKVEVAEGAPSKVLAYPSKTRITFEGDVKDEYETTYTLYVDGKMFSEAPQLKRWRLSLDTASLKGSSFQLKITKYRPSVGRSDVASFTLNLADGIGRTISAVKLLPDGRAQIDFSGEPFRAYKLRLFVNGAVVGENLPGESSVTIPGGYIEPGEVKLRGEAIVEDGSAYPIAEKSLVVEPLVKMTMDGPRTLEVSAANAEKPLVITVTPDPSVQIGSTEIVLNGKRKSALKHSDLTLGDNEIIGSVKTASGGYLTSLPMTIKVTFEMKYAATKAGPMVYGVTVEPIRRGLRLMCGAGDVIFENRTVGDLSIGAWAQFLAEAQKIQKGMPSEVPRLPGYAHEVKLFDLLQESHGVAAFFLRLGKSMEITHGHNDIVLKAEDDKVLVEMQRACVRAHDEITAIYKSVGVLDKWASDNKELVPGAQPLNTPDLAKFSERMEVLSTRHRLFVLIEEMIRHTKERQWELRLKAMKEFRERLKDQRNVKVGAAETNLIKAVEALIARDMTINAKKDLQEERKKLVKGAQNLTSRTRIAEIDRRILELQDQFEELGDEAVRQTIRAARSLDVTLDGIGRFMPQGVQDFRDA